MGSKDHTNLLMHAHFVGRKAEENVVLYFLVLICEENIQSWFEFRINFVTLFDI